MKYNVSDYTDNELYDLLDLTNPSDRILEAKILMMIEKYSTANNDDLMKFFEDVYDHFFEGEEDDDIADDEENDETQIEGFTSEPLVESNEQQDAVAIPKLDESSNQTDIIKALQSITDILKGITEKNNTVKTKSIEYVKNNINPLLKQTCKRICMFDSQYRETTLYPSSGNYMINLSQPLTNVVTLRLHAINIPYTWYNISKSYNYNFFRFVSTGPPDFSGIFDLTAKIDPGAYTIGQLTQAINNSFTTMQQQNLDVNVNNTNISYNTSNGKMTMNIGIQNVFTTADYYLDFSGSWTSPYDLSAANTTIGGFLGFVQPQYKLSCIYSRFSYIDNARIQHDISNDTISFGNQNGIFTYGFYIYNYDGSNDTNSKPIPSDVSINYYDKINVSFTINTFVTGSSTRGAIRTALNNALQNNPQLDPNNSSIGLESFNAGSNISYQRYALNIILNRKSSVTKRVGMRQAIQFYEPNLGGTGSVWVGPSSCFMFDGSSPYLSLNDVKAETNNNNVWTFDTTPRIRFITSTPGFDNSNNQFITDIPNGQYVSTDYVNYVDISNSSIVQNALNRTTTDARNRFDKLYNTFKITENMFLQSSGAPTGQFILSNTYNPNNFILDLSGSILADSTFGWKTGASTSLVGVAPYDDTIVSLNNIILNNPVYDTRGKNKIVIRTQADSKINRNVSWNISINESTNLTATDIVNQFSTQLQNTITIASNQYNKIDFSGSSIFQKYIGQPIDSNPIITFRSSPNNNNYGVDISFTAYTNISSQNFDSPDLYSLYLGNQPSPGSSASIVNIALSNLKKNLQTDISNIVFDGYMYYDGTQTQGLFNISMTFLPSNFYLDLSGFIMSKYSYQIQGNSGSSNIQVLGQGYNNNLTTDALTSANNTFYIRSNSPYFGPIPISITKPAKSVNLLTYLNEYGYGSNTRNLLPTFNFKFNQSNNIIDIAFSITNPNIQLTTSDFTVGFSYANTITRTDSWKQYFHLDPVGYRLTSTGLITSERYRQNLEGNVNISFTVNPITLTQNDYNVVLDDVLNPSTSAFYPKAISSWNYYMGWYLRYTDLSSNIVAIGGNSNTISIDINNKNNTFYIRPREIIRGLSSSDVVKIVIPNGIYTTDSALQYVINNAFLNYLNPVSPSNAFSINPNSVTNIQNNPLTTTQGDISSNITQFVFNINNVYSVKNYNFISFDQNTAGMYQANIRGTCTYLPQTRGITLGWQMGFRTNDIYILDPSNAINQLLAEEKLYSYDPTTQMVSLTGDSVVDLYLYYNFYIVLNEGVMNHLNDGLVTIAERDTYIDSSKYANAALTRRTYNYSVNNFTRADAQNQQLTQAMYYATSERSTVVKKPSNLSYNVQGNITNVSTSSQLINTPTKATQPTNMSDIFAVLPIKQQNLTIGQTFTENGGYLQDNDRIYFGPVNISKIHVQLINDRGEILDLNGANWSFSVVCEYLYNHMGDENIKK